MKKLTLLSIMLVLGIGISLIVGCNSSSPEEVLGNPNDPSFQFVDEFVASQALENVGKIIDISFLFFDSIPGVSTASKFYGQRQAMSDESMSVDSFTYAYANGWHSFSFWLKVVDTVDNDTVQINGTDSLRALDNGTPMQVPDSSVDELNIRCHYTFDLTSGTFTGSADYSLDMEGITSNLILPVTINASGTEILNGLEADSQVSCDFSLSNALDAIDVVTDLDGSSCPTSGSLDLTATVDISCSGIGASNDTLDIEGEWNIGAMYDNGMVTVSYTDGTTVWQVTGPCDDPVASPMTRWTPNFD